MIIGAVFDLQWLDGSTDSYCVPVSFAGMEGCYCAFVCLVFA